MSNEVLISADHHIHSHKKSISRLSDCIKVLEWIFETALKRNITNVLFLGDLFHDRNHLEILTLFRTYEVFEKYFSIENNLKLYLLLGNHDLWYKDRWDVFSPVFLKSFKNIQIIDRPCSLKIEDHYIDFLPFTENPIQDLIELRKLNPWKITEKRLLCSHLAIDGAILNTFGTEADVIVEHDNQMIKVTTDFLQGWTKVFLGHYHGSQKLGENNSVEYVGSPLELTFSEAFQQKHIICFNLDNFESEYIVNNFSPKHLILDAKELGRYDLNNNFVICKVPDISSSELIDMKRSLQEKSNIASFEFRPIRSKHKLEKEQQEIFEAKAILESGDELIEKYVKEISVEEKNGLEENLLLDIGRELIKKSDSGEDK